MRSLVLVVASLGVGFGVGYGLRGSAPDAKRAKRSERRTATPDLNRPAPGPMVALRRAVEALPVPDIPRGDGRITGKVVTPEGEPLQGVAVRAGAIAGAWYEGDAPNGPAAKSELEAMVRKFVDWYHRYQVPRSQTTTDLHGRFILEGLADIEHWVTAEHEDWDIGEDGPADTYRPGASVTFVARRLVEVRFDVRWSDGTRPARAQIVWSAPGRHGASDDTWTPEQRVLRLAAGTAKVKAYGNGAESEEKTLDLRPGTVHEVTLTLVGGITGDVVSGGMSAKGMLRIYALAFTGTVPPTRARLVEAGKQDRAIGGKFLMQGLEPGRYLVGVAAGGDKILATTVVEVARGMTRCTLDLDTADRTGLLRLMVYGPDEKPRTDVKVSSGYLTGVRASTWGDTGVLQKDGSFLVSPPRDPAPGAPLFVEVESDELGTKRAFYRPGQAELAIRFGEPATLAVELAGDAWRHCWLGLSRPDGMGRNLVSSSHDPAERHVIGPAEAGEYELLVIVHVTEHHGVILVRKRVTLAAGKNDVAVALPPVHRLVVRKVPAKYVLLRPAPSIRWQQIMKQVGADGIATFPHLPAGRYLLWCSDSSTQVAMAVSVVRDTEVDFRATELSALRVHIASGQGPWTSLGLVDGDLIVGVGAEEFETQERLREVWKTLNGDVAFLVQRGAGRLVVRVSMDALNRARRAGGGQLEAAARD